MWNSINWDILGSVANGLGTLFAAMALLYSMTTFQRSLRVTHYTEIDRSYFDILQVALQHPFVQSPTTLATQEQTEKYDVFAFMMWNFLEAIYDRCHDDKELEETWMPILRTEGRRHIEWFDRAENMPRFKDSFRSFVHEKIAA